MKNKKLIKIPKIFRKNKKMNQKKQKKDYNQSAKMKNKMKTNNHFNNKTAFLKFILNHKKISSKKLN